MKQKTRKQRQKEKKARAFREEHKYTTAQTLGAAFIFAFFFFLWGSQLLPVTDPVESNYALTAKEMVLSGDWMSPQIYGKYWYDKPIMVYWMLALSYSLLGFTDLASRLPAAFCGAATVTALVWYVRHILKDNVIAVWSGIMLATSLEFWVISHAVITDSMLMLFTVPTLLSAYIGLTEGDRKHMIIAYAAAGLACLSKGPVGLVLPALFLLIWCGWMKEKTYFIRLFPWQGLLVFFAVVLPWYGGMYALHGSDFIDQFLGLHNVLRATSSEHPGDNHFYYYLLQMPLALLPWTGLFLYEIIKGWKERTPFYRFLFVWCVGTVVFYTLMATKYVTYTYIACAPAMVLASMAAPEVRDGEKVPGLCAVIPFLLLMVALIAGTFYIPGNWGALYIVTVYALWALGFHWKSSGGKRLTVISSVTASALLCVITFGLGGYLHTRSGAAMAEYFHNLPGAHYFFRSYAASFTYYTGETATRLVPTGGEEEIRDPRWNEKYTMPSINDTELTAGGEAVYLYVAKGNRKRFAAWSMADRFTVEKEFDSGVIYKMEK